MEPPILTVPDDDEVNEKLWLDTAGMYDSSNDIDRKA